MPVQTGWRRRRTHDFTGMFGHDRSCIGFHGTVGIQPDGTLWISDKPAQNKWSAGTMHQFGTETNWRQLAQGNTSVVLLKTRWHALALGVAYQRMESKKWPGLRAFTPYQIGTNSDWQELFTMGRIFVRQTDGSVWHLDVNWKKELEKMSWCERQIMTRLFRKLHRATATGNRFCARGRNLVGAQPVLGREKSADIGNRHFAGR